MTLRIMAILLLAQPLGGCVTAEIEEETPARGHVFGPAVEREDEPVTPPGHPGPGDGEGTGTTGGRCCVDYHCPGTDLELTGCKFEGSGLGAAYRACEKACGVTCISSSLYCD